MAKLTVSGTLLLTWHCPMLSGSGGQSEPSVGPRRALGPSAMHTLHHSMLWTQKSPHASSSTSVIVCDVFNKKLWGCRPGFTITWYCVVDCLKLIGRAAVSGPWGLIKMLIKMFSEALSAVLLKLFLLYFSPLLTAPLDDCCSLMTWMTKRDNQPKPSI